MNKNLIILLCTICIIPILLIVNSACAEKDERTELQKQEEFESFFELGMSQNEVEQILDEMGMEFIRDSQLDSGDYFLSYRASYEEWGATSYSFRFNPDGKLIVMFPLQ